MFLLGFDAAVIHTILSPVLTKYKSNEEQMSDKNKMYLEKGIKKSYPQKYTMFYLQILFTFQYLLALFSIQWR